MSGSGAGDEAPAAPPRTGRWLRLVRWALTVALCAFAWRWLLQHADVGALARQAGELPPWAWVLAGAALLAGHAMRALRLRRDWREAGDVGWWRCLRLVLGHNAMVLVMPLRSGEAAYLLAVRRQWGVGWSAAMAALLRWRLQDAAVLAMLAAVLLAPAAWPLRLLLAATAAAALGLVLPRLWSRVATRAAHHGVLPAGPSVWSGLDASAANWILKVLANGGLLAALAGLAPATGWRAALGGELAGVQPLQPPAGLGTYEGGVWLAAALPGGLEARLVAAALAVHAFSLAVALGAAALAQLVLPPARGPEEVCP